MTPRPPAFETATASSGPAATFMLCWGKFRWVRERVDTYPASRMGCLIPKYSVMGVWMTDIVVLWRERERFYAGCSVRTSRDDIGKG